jgi:hypothetical protein
VLHCDPDQLALAALGETLPDDDAAHLAECVRCSAEVASLRRPVDVLSVPALAAPGPAVAPPPGVWDAIAAATGVTAAARPASEPLEPAPTAPVAHLPRRRVPARPSRRWLAVAASLLVGAAAGGGAAVALTRSPDADGTVVARTALDPLLGDGTSGSATVREDGGGRVLRVDLDAPRLDDGYYEVWLMETGAQLMVPVGVLRTGDTELPLPDDLDLAAYRLVDVSVEPLDGVPTHSGVSVARGQLSG